MKYRIEFDVWGYSRGTQVWEVEGETPEEALKNAKQGYLDKLVEDNIVRDDREREEGRVILDPPQEESK